MSAEQLRQNIINKNKTTTPHGIANILAGNGTIILGSLSENMGIRERQEKARAHYVKIFNFDSFDNLRIAYIALILALRSELDPIQWRTYFGDFQLENWLS